MESSSDTVFHYTNAAGLLGIVESGTIWANHVAFMNDAAETRTAISRVYNIADNFLLNDDVEVGHMLRKNIERDDIFVASFSTLSDDLGMWRGYGPDSSYAIEFDNALLQKATRQLDDPLVVGFGPVTYSELEFDREVTEICRRIAAHEIGDGLSKIVHAMTRLKDYDWHAESEVRLTLMLHVHEGGAAANAVSFRAGRFGVTPYVKIPLKRQQSILETTSPDLTNSEGWSWPPGLIRSIRVGPGFHQDTRKIGIDALANKTGADFLVLKSEIAYR